MRVIRHDCRGVQRNRPFCLFEDRLQHRSARLFGQREIALAVKADEVAERVLDVRQPPAIAERIVSKLESHGAEE